MCFFRILRGGAVLDGHMVQKFIPVIQYISAEIMYIIGCKFTIHIIYVHNEEKQSLANTGSLGVVVFGKVNGEKIMMKTIKTLIVSAALLCGAAPSQAAIVTLSPDNVNRLNEFNPATDSDSVFSTRQQLTNKQYTTLFTSTASFNAALLAQLGPLAANQKYQIDSATLTAGSAGDDYTVLSRAHLMITSYDPGDATWNEADNSANTVWGTGSSIDQTGGTDWNSTTIDTGVLDGGGFSVSWSNFGPTVQSWIDGGSNPGLFFEDIGNTVLGSPGHQTSGSNVSWTLDAQIVLIPTPEPSSLGLILLGAGLLSKTRKRKSVL